MEGLDGVGYHFVVIFNDNDWSPKTHHVEVGTGTHQARFGNGGQFSLFAYVAAAFVFTSLMAAFAMVMTE